MLTNLIAILRQAQLMSLAQEQAVVDHIQTSGASVPEALLTLDIFHHHDLTEHLSQIFGLPETDLTRFDYASLCQQLGLRELITQYQALPLQQNGQVLTLAVSDPTHLQIEDEFRFATGLQIELVPFPFNSDRLSYQSNGSSFTSITTLILLLTPASFVINPRSSSFNNI